MSLQLSTRHWMFNRTFIVDCCALYYKEKKQLEYRDCHIYRYYILACLCRDARMDNEKICIILLLHNDIYLLKMLFRGALASWLYTFGILYADIYIYIYIRMHLYIYICFWYIDTNESALCSQYTSSFAVYGSIIIIKSIFILWFIEFCQAAKLMLIIIYV